MWVRVPPRVLSSARRGCIRTEDSQDLGTSVLPNSQAGDDGAQLRSPQRFLPWFGKQG